MRRRTSVADCETGKLAGGPVGVLAARDEGREQAGPLHVPVEEGRVPAQVAQQVADAGAHRSVRVRQQLPQLREDRSFRDRRIVVAVQARQLAHDEQGACQRADGVLRPQQPVPQQAAVVRASAQLRSISRCGWKKIWAVGPLPCTVLGRGGPLYCIGEGASIAVYGVERVPCTYGERVASTVSVKGRPV